jgi:hypothetical protein
VGWQALVASLVQSLAWPAVVAVAVIVLHKPIGAVLAQGIRHVKAGPVEVEFDRLQAEVREDLARSPELAEAQVPAPAASLREELSRLAEIAPGAAVVTAYNRIEDRLAEILDSPGAPPHSGLSGWTLTKMARQRDLISDETVAAIDAMSVLRDLAAQSFGDISTDRAREYLTLADRVLYVLRSKPSS